MLKRDFFWNSIGGLLNTVNSFLFFIIVTRINGIEDAGVFSLCFAVSNMLLIIGLYSGRTFQISNLQNKVNDYEFLINRVLTSLIMIIACYAWGYINDYNAYKITILSLLVIFKATESFSDGIYGIYQKNFDLYIAGKSMLIKSTLNIILFVVTDLIFRNIYISCAVLSMSNIIVIFTYDIRHLRLYINTINININIKNVFSVFRFGFMPFIYTFIANYMVNIPRYTVDKLMEIEYQTLYSIISMPATVIMVANMFVLQPILIKLKYNYECKRISNLNKDVLIVVFISLAVCFASIFFLDKIGILILELVYNVGLLPYKKLFFYIIFGATMYTISSVFSNCLLIMNTIKVQVFIYLSTSVIAFFTCGYIIEMNGLKGAALSYLLMMLILMCNYIAVYTIRIGRERINEKK